VLALLMFAGAVILLLWIWIAAGAAVLLGAELDAELRARRVVWSARPA
jgi:uncharacterized BrkB/YihY/UPF0761 family membrane protein